MSLFFSQLPTPTSFSRSRLEHQQRIGAGWDALPDIGVALHEPPGAAATGQHQLVALEPPSRQRKTRDGAVATGLDDELVVGRRRPRARQGQRTERLLDLAQEIPITEHLLGVRTGMVTAACGCM